MAEEVKCGKDATKLHLEVEEVDKVHPKTEGVGQEHLSSLIAIVASILEPSPPEVGHALTTSAALGSLFFIL